LFKNDLTNENLAFKLKISPQILHNLFKKNNTNIYLLKKIGEVFGVSVKYFFDDYEKKLVIDKPVEIKRILNLDNLKTQILDQKDIEIMGLKIELKVIKEQLEEYKTIIKQKDEMIEKLFTFHK